MLDVGLELHCKECKWLLVLNEVVRLSLSQENKEILNTLERSDYDLSDFGYCQMTGFIESLIALKTCAHAQFTN